MWKLGRGLNIDNFTCNEPEIWYFSRDPNFEKFIEVLGIHILESSISYFEEHLPTIV